MRFAQSEIDLKMVIQSINPGVGGTISRAAL